ncbi:hypothetical protein CLM85_16200 [Streptomyces albidoflavus]|nr:hypothetical protein CLM81_07575 [Streptomyces albidoflavus]PAX90473.1 hypothetical protein CLM82_15130 [Streptomyces albidoflavus]PBO16169.1 hypothetical protein CLM83_25465 [Streptomyces albidoflavus]PBO23422.1 hypothetical protein CLM85_16200 [Streptomyces albidoflavus]PBO26633.1 hypothetical protein CLM84_30620 [Streptomyces albidoflavus]
MRGAVRYLAEVYGGRAESVPRRDRRPLGASPGWYRLHARPVRIPSAPTLPEEAHRADRTRR